MLLRFNQHQEHTLIRYTIFTTVAKVAFLNSANHIKESHSAHWSVFSVECSLSFLKKN